jgi:hypothetical protein
MFLHLLLPIFFFFKYKSLLDVIVSLKDEVSYKVKRAATPTICVHMYLYKLKTFFLCFDGCLHYEVA